MLLGSGIFYTFQVIFSKLRVVSQKTSQIHMHQGIEAERISPEVLVRKIDLPNRYKDGERCRAVIADVITKLSYSCLPPIFSAIVNNTFVWAELQPRSPQSDGVRYLDAFSDEVILFDALSDWHDGAATEGEVNHSRYNLCLAFASAGVAVSLALKRAEDLEGATLRTNLRTFFGKSLKAA